MKTFLSFCFLFAFIGLLFICCSDKSISPEESTANNNPVSLQKETGPGAWIFRYDFNEWAFWFTDAESGLVLLIGITDPWSNCEQGGFIESFKVHDLYLPKADTEELRRNICQVKGKNLTAMVWKPNSWPTEFTENFCDFLSIAGNTFAIGNVNYTNIDNDYYSPYQDNKNHNAFGYKANGTLLGSDGKTYKLNFVYNAVWDGVDITSYKEVLKIQLTPTGN